jgi:hypothetical protein
MMRDIQAEIQEAIDNKDPELLLDLLAERESLESQREKLTRILLACGMMPKSLVRERYEA